MTAQPVQKLKSNPNRSGEFKVFTKEKQARMLVVDDENGPRQALRMLLLEEYDVLMATNVPEALEVLKEETVDIIITDIRMPQQTGLDLLRQVKELYPNIQVIILTGYGQLETAMSAVEYGAFAYLEKPFDNQVMLSKVEACLEKVRQEKERRAMEYLAIQANRFETLGHLVSGTMHDLGTPLSVIGTHLDLILGAPERQDISDRLETMKAQIGHCNDLVRTTMNFLRDTSEEMSPLSLNSAVQLCLDVAQPFMGRVQVSVITRLANDLATCKGNIVLIRQAILNLINNACQAMEVQEPPREILIETWNEDHQVCLAIKDNGPGVPDEHKQKIFDALYTTKGDKGTGLGLSVVRNVMEHHQGSIILDEKTTDGARFILRFPTVNIQN